MINALQRKFKKIKLNDIYFKFAEEKNIYRGQFFFNFRKFRKKKWKYHRRNFLYNDNIIFRRYAPNLTYVPNYSSYINKTVKGDKLKMNTISLLLSYKSRLFLKRKIRGFFNVRSSCELRKIFVFRHITTHFNVFDSNFDIVLLRLGLADTIREAKEFIYLGVLRINGRMQRRIKHLNHLDLVEFTKNDIVPFRITSFFSRRKKKWSVLSDFLVMSAFDYLSLLMSDFDIKNFLGFLPFTSTINLTNFSFIYFSYLMKNQWHFWLDFFVAKKFFHYNR
jgi:hypothetical protein